MKKQFAALALFAAIAAPAMADGFYVGADAGRSKFEVDLGGGYKASKNDTALSMFAGYDVHPNFAIEAGYGKLGEFKESNGAYSASADVTALKASLIGKVQVGDGIDLFGRVGVANVKAKGDERGPGYVASYSDKESKTFFGIGARYAVTKEFGVRAEYNQFAKFDELKVSTLTFGADYRF